MSIKSISVLEQYEKLSKKPFSENEYIYSVILFNDGCLRTMVLPASDHPNIEELIKEYSKSKKVSDYRLIRGTAMIAESKQGSEVLDPDHGIYNFSNSQPS